MADNEGYQTRSRALRTSLSGLFGSTQRVDVEPPAQHAPLADPAQDMSDNLKPIALREDVTHNDKSDGPPAQHTTQVVDGVDATVGANNGQAVQPAGKTDGNLTSGTPSSEEVESKLAFAARGTDHAVSALSVAPPPGEERLLVAADHGPSDLPDTIVSSNKPLGTTTTIKTDQDFYNNIIFKNPSRATYHEEYVEDLVSSDVAQGVLDSVLREPPACEKAWEVRLAPHIQALGWEGLPWRAVWKM